MNKAVVVALAVGALALGGCSATNRDAGTGIGAVGGAILGSTIGKGSGRILATGAGAVLGGVIGSKVGENMDKVENHEKQNHQPTVVQERVIIERPVPPAPIPVYRPDFSVCNQYVYEYERDACRRGVIQRFDEEQRWREHEAYRRGLGKPIRN